MSALAVCFIYDPAREQCFHERFEGDDPLAAAHAFAEDLRERDDFPGALITVTGNDAAGKIQYARRMASLGFPPSEGTEQ